MKQIRFVVLFLCTLGIIDLMIGFTTKMVVSYAPQTQYNLSNTIQTLFHQRSDILVLGASRAHHSYDPRIIEKETHLSCYNGGRSGVKIDYFSSCVDAYLSRCTPQLIILDISSDMMESSNEDLYKNLRCLYGISEPITCEMDSVYSPLERLKMKSALYRNNRLFNEVLQLCFSQKRPDLKGFQPLIDRNYKTPFHVYTKLFVANKDRVKKLNHIVEVCKEKKVKLIIAYAPTLKLTDSNGCSQWLKNYCFTNQIPYYDYSWLKKYYLHPELFKDEVHLNSNGAQIFTQDFCKVISKYIK